MINVDFNTGNFTLAIAIELSKEAIAKKLEEGVRYAVQRDVASKVYIGLAGKPNSKGTLTLPEGFERDSIPFNTENAAEFKALAEAELNKLGEATVIVTENVGGEKETGKMAAALWALVKDNDEMRDKLGLAPDADDAAGLAATKAWQASQRKSKKA